LFCGGTVIENAGFGLCGLYYLFPNGRLLIGCQHAVAVNEIGFLIDSGFVLLANPALERVHVGGVPGAVTLGDHGLTVALQHFGPDAPVGCNDQGTAVQMGAVTGDVEQ
jgi:hypothetical protein